MTCSSWRKASRCFGFSLMMVTSQAIQSPRRSHSPRPEVVLRFRGGDLGPISGTNLAKTFGGLTATHAVSGALFPRTAMRWFGIFVPKGSLSDKYLHGIGASAATIAVSTYSAVTGVPVEQAIAFGFWARMIYMTLMILRDEEKKVGMRFSTFGTMWLILAATVYALLQGIEDSLVFSKVVSLVLGVHGLFLHTYPGVVLRKSAISVGPDPLEKEILSIDGGYMLASATTTFLLAQGVDPVKVVGFSAVMGIPVIIKVFGVIEAEHLWDFGIGHLAMAATFILACIVVGTLH